MKQYRSNNKLTRGALVLGLTLSVCIPVIEPLSVVAESEVGLNQAPLAIPPSSASSIMNEGEILISSSHVSSSELVNDTSSNEDATSENINSENSSSYESTEESTNDVTDSSSKDTSSNQNSTSTSSSKNESTKPSSSKNDQSSTTSKPNNQSNTSSSSTSSANNITDSSSDKKNTDKKNNTKPNNTPIKFSKNQTTAEFIEEVGESAREIGQKNNLYASVMIAQAILESGSGNSGLSRGPNYNLFGIKGSYKGHSVEMATLEDDGKGGMYTISAKFRKYPSYKESLEDYAMLMSGGISGKSTFYQGAWKSTTDSYTEATRYLTGRYATDTRYNEKLNGLIETYNLTEYDQASPVKTKVEKTKETEDFIKEISVDAENIADKNDLYASVLIAEAIIKSNSGNHELMAENNIYQILGQYDNKSREFETLVTTDKELSIVKESYKVYPSTKVSLEDYVAELKKDQEVLEEMTRSKKDTPRKVTAYLTAQNKEDRRYHRRLNGLIDTYDLTRFDKESDASKEKKEQEKNSKEKKKEEQQKNESTEILRELGLDLRNKLTESLYQPRKYSFSPKK